MKKLLIILTILFSLNGFSQNLPEKMNPPRLVNDFANILDASEEASLEAKLVDFNKTSSTQIAIVTVKSLEGYDISDFGVKLAQKWGIGQKGKDNGILITLKPKTETQGKINLTIGYGLEHVVPDAASGRIIDNEMIPRFKENDFYGGLNNATTVLIELTKGEYTADNYLADTSGSGGAFGGLITIIILFLFFRGIFGRRRYSSVGRSSSLPFWLAAGMMSSNRSHGGSFGNFSSGSGGFGGFGGGSFGGGGASGSW